jgi:hypothetical protein
MSDSLTDRHATLLHEWVADAQDAGVVTPDVAELFLLDVERRQRSGLSFSYAVNFRITAIKPTA